jgi:5-(carboxyamino)imidazole ribonucleotide synthase
MFKTSPFSSGFRIGFIGGGQLARMSALQAFRFGMEVAVYASTSDEPLCSMTPHVTIGAPDDEATLTAFAASCDVVTLENEFLDSSLLLRVRDASGTPMFPSPESFAKIEDKIIEKTSFAQAGIPVADWREVRTQADLQAFGDEFGWPYILKSAKGGYDGYGNATARDVESALVGFRKLGGDSGRAILAEAMVPFTNELAVMVARNLHGIAVYPCTETIQQNHICKEVLAPAPIPEALRVQAQELAVAAMEAIDATGIFGFEFFLTHDHRILLNESAPRPHNSGHYSIDACIASQFENHVRAVCQLPLGSTEMRRPVAVMINTLGTHNRPALVEGLAPVLATPDAHFHLYGKKTSKIGRKMGHVTMLGDDLDVTCENARTLANSIQI